MAMSTQDLRERWREAHQTFLSSPGVWERHAAWAREQGVLPISNRWDYVFGVDEDGVVWANLDEDLGGELNRFYPDPPCRVWLTRHRQEALLDGAKKHPWLREWAGERPSDAVDCACGGELPHPIICNQCGNAGWITPEEATALGQDVLLPVHVVDYVMYHFHRLYLKEERETYGLLCLGFLYSETYARMMRRSGRAQPVHERLLENGTASFLHAAAVGVFQRAEHEVQMLRCHRCNGLCRTPRARQCRWCGHDWHEVAP